MSAGTIKIGSNNGRPVWPWLVGALLFAGLLLFAATRLTPSTVAVPVTEAELDEAFSKDLGDPENWQAAADLLEKAIDEESISSATAWKYRDKLWAMLHSANATEAMQLQYNNLSTKIVTLFLNESSEEQNQ